MKLLIVDDDKNLRKVLFTELSGNGYDISLAENGVKALNLFKKESFDVVLLDLNMPGTSGLDVLKEIKTNDISVEVIIFTAYAAVSTAVEAMKMGAYDYLTKPFSIQDLSSLIQKAFERRRLIFENISLKTQIKYQIPTKSIITRSPLMLNILEDIKKISRSEAPILITGESGVGKELVARAIHDFSERADNPFIPINCGAIPGNMLESELFGFEKGAFSGASFQKAGMIEIANGGTLFFDEIGELPLALQVKLLRVLETQCFYRLGGTREIKVDVKIISATNKDLEEVVKEANFRHDLYYRISTFKIHVPPLRERREDIHLLIDHFIKNNRSFKGASFTEKAIQALSKYNWPGNVRELQNVLHRTILLSNNKIIDTDELPQDIIMDKKPSAGKSIYDVEKEHILKILKETSGNQKKAAEILGIDSKTLYRKLKNYEIEKTAEADGNE